MREKFSVLKVPTTRRLNLISSKNVDIFRDSTLVQTCSQVSLSQDLIRRQNYGTQIKHWVQVKSLLMETDLCWFYSIKEGMWQPFSSGLVGLSDTKFQCRQQWWQNWDVGAKIARFADRLRKNFFELTLIKYIQLKIFFDINQQLELIWFWEI